jgi:hypothetical protein
VKFLMIIFKLPIRLQAIRSPKRWHNPKRTGPTQNGPTLDGPD